jgi:hypothetical protein
VGTYVNSVLNVIGSKALNTVTTEDQILMYRDFTDAASFPQAAAFKLGRYVTDVNYASKTRLDLALRSNLTNYDIVADLIVMTWTNQGYVGINTVLPDAALHVVGNTHFGGAVYTWPTSDGTNDYVLTTNGSGVLSWSQKTGGTSGTIVSLNGISASAQTIAGLSPLEVITAGTTHTVRLNSMYSSVFRDKILDPTGDGYLVFSQSPTLTGMVTLSGTITNYSTAALLPSYRYLSFGATDGSSSNISWNGSQLIFKSSNYFTFGSMADVVQFATNVYGVAIPSGLAYQVGSSVGISGTYTNPTSLTFTGGIVTGAVSGTTETRSITFQVYAPATTVATGTGVGYISIPKGLDDWNIDRIQAHTYGSTTGNIEFQVQNSGSKETPSWGNILSSSLIVTSGYLDSSSTTSGTPTSNLKVYEGYVLRINISTAGASRTGLDIRIDFVK